MDELRSRGVLAANLRRIIEAAAPPEAPISAEERLMLARLRKILGP